MLSVSAGNLFGLSRAAPAATASAPSCSRLRRRGPRRLRPLRRPAPSRGRTWSSTASTPPPASPTATSSAPPRRSCASSRRGEIDEATTERLLDALYMPRLIRHIQVMYRGMIDAGTRVYVKVGTTGTGGMGLNIPYTHSEERPSRVLLSKSALAGAQSMLLFLMARTPGAPITKEIKPAAAIAWKRMGYGPIFRGGKPLRMVDARPHPLGATFSTEDPAAARERDEPYENVFIDTGENGVFSLEEFSTVTSHEQMEFVTPEEIARYLVFEIEGRGTGLRHRQRARQRGARPHLPGGHPAALGAGADERDGERARRAQRRLRDAGAAAQLQAPLRGPPAAPRLPEHERRPAIHRRAGARRPRPPGAREPRGGQPRRLRGHPHPARLRRDAPRRPRSSSPRTPCDEPVTPENLEVLGAGRLGRPPPRQLRPLDRALPDTSTTRSPPSPRATPPAATSATAASGTRWTSSSPARWWAGSSGRRRGARGSSGDWRLPSLQ